MLKYLFIMEKSFAETIYTVILGVNVAAFKFLKLKKCYYATFLLFLKSKFLFFFIFKRTLKNFFIYFSKYCLCGVCTRNDVYDTIIVIFFIEYMANVSFTLEILVFVFIQHEANEI